MKNKQKQMEIIRKQAEETGKIKKNSEDKKIKQRIENSAKIIRFKEQLENDKKKKFDTIFEVKKKSYAEIREIRDKSMREKYQMYVETMKYNQIRSTSVKIDHKRQALRQRRLEKSREEENRQDYLKRVSQVITMKNNIENKIIEMEAVEMGLIKKLQNTQSIQAKTLSDLKSALKKKPSTALK